MELSGIFQLSSDLRLKGAALGHGHVGERLAIKPFFAKTLAPITIDAGSALGKELAPTGCIGTLVFVPDAWKARPLVDQNVWWWCKSGLPHGRGKVLLVWHHCGAPNGAAIDLLL